MSHQATSPPRKSAGAAALPRYVTLDEAAAILSCSVLTVRRRIAAGDLPGFKVGRSKSIRVRLEDIEAMMRPIPAAGGGSVA